MVVVSGLIKLLSMVAMVVIQRPSGLTYVYGVMVMAAYTYGGIGHSKPLGLCIPPPDYSKAVEVTYQETTAGLIKKLNDLQVLFNIQCPRLRTFNSTPSWVIGLCASLGD